ncbi:MAG: MFS transporter [Clostridia bacterium]|nr:MFS transporter [Clostridia bacterium]
MAFKKLRKSYHATIVAACLGYITQAIMINFPPLLFMFFQNKMGLELWQVSLLVTANFITELIVDVIASKYASQVGYRPLVIIASFVSTVGLLSMFILPDLLPSTFFALIISMIFCGIGGGLMEVLISPIVEACPTKNKSGTMSILHSFYSWGSAGVVALSTIFFLVFGLDNWMIAAFFLALIPFINMFLFMYVPIYTLVPEGEEMKPKELFSKKFFWLLVIMMMCAGATEVAMSQWASAFAETAVGRNDLKWLTDLLGPCMFALCMAITRTVYGKLSEKINIEKAIFLSSLVCVVAYLITIIAPFPAISLIGCGVCGIGAGILWPGSFSIASSKMPKGGVFMFGMLALAGDFGCLAGPSIAGQISAMANENLKVGFIFAIIFPILLSVISFILILRNKKNK